MILQVRTLSVWISTGPPHGSIVLSLATAWKGNVTLGSLDLSVDFFEWLMSRKMVCFWLDSLLRVEYENSMEISFSRLCFTTQFVPEMEISFSRLCFTNQWKYHFCFGWILCLGRHRPRYPPQNCPSLPFPSPFPVGYVGFVMQPPALSATDATVRGVKP